MGRPNDPFWKYAVNRQKRCFTCMYCRIEFAGGVTRLKYHLSGFKSHDIKVCEQVPPYIRLEVRDTLKKKDRQVEDENCLVPSSSGGRNLCMDNDNILMGQNDNNNLLEMNRVPNLSNEKDKYQLLDKQLAKWFFLYGIDSTAIDSPIFKDFVKSIGEYGLSYQLPRPSGSYMELILDVEKEAREYLRNFINDQVQASCTLMVNIWRNSEVENSTPNGEIFAYSHRGAACLKSWRFVSGLKNIQELISSTIELVGPNRVVQLLLGGVEELDDYDDRDDWDDRDVFIPEFKNYHPRICISLCATEEIVRFLVDASIKKSFEIHTVQLIFYTYHYYNVSSRRGLKKSRNDNSFSLLILKSVLKIEDKLKEDSFSSIIESSDRVKWLDDGPEKAKHLKLAILIDYIIGHNEFWSRVKALEQVWVLLCQIWCLVNNEDSSIGYLYQMMERLKDGIEKSREYDHVVYDRTWEVFSSVREKIIHPMHATAAFLDPAYFCTDNFEENGEIMDGLQYMFENMVDSDEKEAFTKELQQYRMKLPKLFNAQAITMLKSCHPRIWWDLCGKHTVPVLRKYAIRIVSQPCSTLFCRRFDGLRNELRSEDWSTKMNTMIIFENSKSQMLEPIILDKLDEDLGAFNDDLTEGELERYMYRLSYSVNDTLVNSVINDSRPIWDNLKNNSMFLYYRFN